MKRNANDGGYIEKFPVTNELLDQIHARTQEQAQRRIEKRQRAEAWPGDVDRLLESLATEVAALRARVGTLEAAGG